MSDIDLKEIQAKKRTEKEIPKIAAPTKHTIMDEKSGCKHILEVPDAGIFHTSLPRSPYANAKS